MRIHHVRYTEGDEEVCSCGLRWYKGESDPHPVEPVVNDARPSMAVTMQRNTSLKRVEACRKRNGLKRSK